MSIAKSLSQPAELRYERHESAAGFHAAPTELGLICSPKAYKQVARNGAFNPLLYSSAFQQS
jgi:hypothetical protein